jgi:16S rRNA (adenine1518-N6/adenine1519-N6)-dimethyltransferase
LGQHFLVSEGAVRRITESVADMAGILEVGPGPGAITLPLSLAHPVLAIELDERWRDLLACYCPDVEVIYQDALQADLATHLEALPAPRAIVSNMPYNITGPLLAAFSAQAGRVERLVLMMQKEVADRIIAPAGDAKRGALSVVMQAQFAVKWQQTVPPGAFAPPPKVQSAVLEFTPRAVMPAGWAEFVHAGFRQPRKTLANNLRERGGAALIDSAGLAASIRPHQLTEAEWQTLWSHSKAN